MFPSFTGLQRPVKGTKVSTVLSTPGQVTIGGRYLGIGMGGHFEGFGGCEGLAWKDPQANWLLGLRVMGDPT